MSSTLQPDWEALRSRLTDRQVIVASIVATAALGTLAVWAWSRSRVQVDLQAAEKADAAADPAAALPVAKPNAASRKSSTEDAALGKCGHCHNAARQRCSRCSGVVYCSRECQRLDWRRHKQVCGKLAPSADTDRAALKRRALETALQSVCELCDRGRFREALQKVDPLVSLSKDCEYPLATLHSMYLKGFALLMISSVTEAAGFLAQAAQCGQAMLGSIQANASYFQPAAEQPAHDHGRDAVQHYLKAASKIAPADVQCITGDCCVCLSTAARRVGNPEFAVEQAELAVGAAKACKCPRLHAAAQGSLAIATFQMDRHKALPMFREALSLRLSDVTRTLKQGFRAPHTAVPELIPAVCNLSSAGRAGGNEGAMLQPAHALAFLPFVDPHTAQQLLIAVHSIAEAAGSQEGPQLELDVDLLLGGDILDDGAAAGLGPESMLETPPGEETSLRLSDWQHLLAACVVSSQARGDADVAGRVCEHVRDLKGVVSSSGYACAAWTRRKLQELMDQLAPGRTLEEECPVCCEAIDPSAPSTSGGELIVLICGHIMHVKCWDAWMSRSNDNDKCPVCRVAVDTTRDL